MAAGPLLSSLNYCLISVIFFSASVLAETNQDILELNGIWQFKPQPPINVTRETKPPLNGWDSIKVPDNWYRQNKDIHGQAWYQKQFVVDSKTISKQAHLVFKGIDYKADVWLNNVYLGHHEGYFQPFEFDVSSLLKKGRNTLTVLVDSPLEKPEDWSLHKKIIKGIFSHHDTRPGGAWSVRGQEQNTGGIWAPVQIELSDNITIRQLSVTPKKSNENWQLAVNSVVLNKFSDSANITVRASVIPDNFTGESYQFEKIQSLSVGQQNLPLQLSIENPMLWWPTEYGKPNLYKLQLQFIKDGKVIDQQEKIFGFREIVVDDKLQWFINGHRIFVRGTNYIASQWLAEMTPARFQQDLNMMRQANINAVRVHAHITAPDFYELCDRMGMLVMQDFPLLWGYSDDPQFIAQARSQASDMVSYLGHHPSIVSWTMHNEPPWDSPWMAQKYPDYQPDINKQLDQLLYMDIQALDDTRVVRKESATIEHEWLGWYFGTWREFSRKMPTPWRTEFGAQALPDKERLKLIFNEQELWPDSEEKWKKWEYHNFQRRESFELAGIAQGKNIDEFIQNTQQYQARLIQYAVENYRRQRYEPVSAIFQFMFVENWPSINWGIVDYWRKPKPGYESLRIAYQPILPSLEWTKDVYKVGEPIKIGLWAINDTLQGFEHGQYIVSLYHEDKTIDQLALPLEMLPDSGYKLRDYPISFLKAGTYKIKSQIKDKDGNLLGENLYRFKVE